MTPRCWLCDTAEHLRKLHDGWGKAVPPEYSCEECFRGTDDGPSWDDLEEPKAPEAQSNEN